MKFFLLIMLFVCFIFIGLGVYFFYHIRLIIFKDMCFICSYLKNNISFNKNTITQILDDCKDNLSCYSKFCFSNNNIRSIKFLKSTDSKNIVLFFNSLGQGDVDYEINNLNYYENIFNNAMQKAKEDVKLKGLTYFKLITLLGVMVIILLI